MIFLSCHVGPAGTDYFPLMLFQGLCRSHKGRIACSVAALNPCPALSDGRSPGTYYFPLMSLRDLCRLCKVPRHEQYPAPCSDRSECSRSSMREGHRKLLGIPVLGLGNPIWFQLCRQRRYLGNPESRCCGRRDEMGRGQMGNGLKQRWMGSRCCSAGGNGCAI
jgi:hypothetical protein